MTVVADSDLYTPPCRAQRTPDFDWAGVTDLSDAKHMTVLCETECALYGWCRRDAETRARDGEDLSGQVVGGRFYGDAELREHRRELARERRAAQAAARPPVSYQHVGRWVTEHTRPGEHTSTAVLYAAFTTWAAREGFAADYNIRSFGSALNRHGVPAGHKRRNPDGGKTYCRPLVLVAS